jgi:hypothetical protein
VGVDVSVLSKHERSGDRRFGTATALLLGQPRFRASIPGKEKVIFYIAPKLADVRLVPI